MQNKRQYTHQQWFVILTLTLSMIALTACRGMFTTDDGIPRAERPRATSTPVAAVQGDEAASKAPMPALAFGELADTPTDSAVTLSPEMLGGLTTEEQLNLVVVPTRDLRDLALRLKPDVNEIPTVVNDTVPDYQIGEQLDFWVHNVDTNTNREITTELIHKTDVAYAWVEVGHALNSEAVIDSINRFSEQSYPAEVAFFGNEANPGIDNDPRLHILHATGTGSGVAGYFSSADEYSKLANEFSNEKEMFYINLDWLNRANDFEYYETVLAHEFQHMVHWANDRNEETWLNEGLSEFAQEVAGYAPDTTFASSFGNRPDTQLNTWNETTASNAEHYGSAYLFVTYFAQRFGPELTKALVANPANGVDSVNDVLAAAGFSERFEEVFGDWIIANYVDDPNALGLDGIYGYREFTQRAPALAQDIDDFPVEPQTATVNNYATDYILLKGAGDITINFAGSAETRLAATDAYSGKLAWWANRGDDSDTRLTRQFDFTEIAVETPIQMDVTMWWDIEEAYDYGYALASVDGQKWDILEGARSTAANPNGNSFGAAYTARSTSNSDESAEWVEEQYDLSPYAGTQVFVRFEYVTDDAVNSSGWLIDDMSIDAIGYSTDFESIPDGWQSEGWLLTDNRLGQGWLLQVLTLDDNILTDIQRIQPNDDGNATINVDGLGGGRTAVLTISAIAPVTTEPATYEFGIDLR